MRRVMVLAVLAASGTLVGAASAPARLVCPPGTTNPAYCTKVLPHAITGGATQVTYNSAVLTGAVTRDNEPVTYYFLYGTTTSYGSTTEHGTVRSMKLLHVAIRGLDPLTTYHYRLVAQDKEGVVYGRDRVFKTSKTPPGQRRRRVRHTTKGHTRKAKGHKKK